MALSKEEREGLDAKLSPFKSWDLIADIKWDIIWVFDKVAYHWWNPEIEWLWNYIFADFKKAITRKWRAYWHVFEDWCWDDDVYIDRRRKKLSANYRFATEAEKQLYDIIMLNDENIKEIKERRCEAVEEKLCILIDQYILDQRTGRAFLKYCQAECGWINELDVNIDDFKTCLENFKNEHPEYAHNIKMD